MIHVYPLKDEREHDTTDTTTCWCDPRLDESNYGEMIVIHNSMDGRELIEQAEEINNESRVLR